MSKFKVGDQAVILDHPGIPQSYRYMIGEIVTLVAYLGQHPHEPDNIFPAWWAIRHDRLVLKKPFASEVILQKLPSCDDSLEIVSWDSCPWQPEKQLIEC